MKLLPRLMTARQAFVLCAAAAILAIALKLFAPFAVALLLVICCLAGLYAIVLQWAPEFVKPDNIK